MRPLHLVVMGAIGLTLVAAGCGGAIPSSNGGSATLKTMQTSEGRFLVDGRGQSLYLFDKDEDGESYCTGACAAVWPPFETDSTPRAATGVASAALGTVERDDGDRQVTYHGHPLYYYAADASTPGRTKGEEADQFGAEWYLVGQQGKALEAKTSESKPGSGSNDGGGGYP
jgi:predicted lipoprotein with Yx(FWY)xxD motif